MNALPAARPAAPGSRVAGQSQPGGSGRAPAFSLVELLLAGVLLAGVLAVTAGVYRHLLDRARVGETRKLLQALARATSGLPENAVLEALASADGQAVFDALCAQPTAATVAAHVSPHVWSCRDGRAVCSDAWGRSLRVIKPGSADAANAQRMQLAAGAVLFESAGPDGDFGDDRPSRRMDNLRSDDPIALLSD